MRQPSDPTVLRRRRTCGIPAGTHFPSAQSPYLDSDTGVSYKLNERPISGSDADPGGGTCTLAIADMDCSSCAESVTRALHAVDGVREVEADVVGGRVTILYDRGALIEDDLAGAVRRAGYEVVAPEAHPSAVYQVDGVCCAVEARELEEKLLALPGIRAVGFDVVGQRITVQGEVAPGGVEQAAARLGMKAVPVSDAPAPPPLWRRQERLILVSIAGFFWAASLLTHHLLDLDAAAAVFAVAAIVAGGRFIVPRGILAARNRSLDMNFLMTIAAIGALIIGEYGEAASAMFLFAVAQLLESRSMDRARNAIRGLMDLSPASASVLLEGREHRVPADSVLVGQTVIVRPGEKIPVDGEIAAGSSMVNQASITGEAVPVEKESGDEVFAGTLNGDGVLEVRSTRPAEDTTLARIIHTVEEAQSHRAPSQTFVDRFARVYTPAVVASAVALAILPPLLGFGGFGEWFYRALVLLVVACPCALVISTPVTIVSALAGAARRGILIKGGLHLENAGRARVVVLDKTGTLTEGQPAVVEVVAFGDLSSHRVLELAAAVETRSEHPLARAIARHATEVGIDPPAATAATALPGRGMRAVIGEELIYVGTERLFREMGAITDAAADFLKSYEARGRTAVLVGSLSTHEGRESMRVLGAVALSDRVRPHAAAAIHELRRAGISRIVMLTGDNPGTAQAVAEVLETDGRGLDEYRAELLPQDKVDAVRRLREEHGGVVFVGDGVNDAPALALADVGVAMGSGGTDVALETADIALMGDDLSQLPVTIRLARKAEGIIRFNIAISLITKAIFVALAVTGHATLWMAVAADMGTSLLVTFNGMRALRP
jgi:Zn2+/Cd2+-exporting ATPase